MSIYKRKSGRYAVLLPPIIVAGKLKRPSLGTFRTKKDAEEAERVALVERDRGTDLVPKKVTVEVLMRRFLDDRALRCGLKTIQEYERLSTRCILPQLGKLFIAKLRPAHVSDWQATLQKSGGKAGAAL